MENRRPRIYFQNVSLATDLPKIIFLFLYLTILVLTFSIFFVIDLDYKQTYQKYFEEKINSIKPVQTLNKSTAYEQYIDLMQSEVPQTPQIRNITIILWDEKGNVLWHSNKLIEKFVLNDSKKSNELFKGMSFLDIPEKKFKPYEEYEKYKKSSVENNIITKFKKRMVFHFYKIPNSGVYVQILRDFDKIISWKLFLAIQLGILLVSGLAAWFSAILIRFLIKPLKEIGASITHFHEYNQAEAVPETSENEIGQLVMKYNKLLKKISSGQTVSLESGSDKNQKMISFLQEKLVRKSIHKSNLVELLMYPKSTEGDFRKFVTLEEGNDYTNILYAHFDINNIESNIEKHIIQDRFRESSAKSTNLLEIARELQTDCISHSDLGPGFLLIQIRNNQIQWNKSGPFQIFMADKESGVSWPLVEGYDYIPSENIEIAEEEIDKNTLLIISDDLLDLLNLDANEFNNQIMNPAVHQNIAGKPLLLNIMKTIENINPDILKQFPMISLIRIK